MDLPAETFEQIENLVRESYKGKGKFVSPFSEYPGYIQFVYPFLGEHYKAWVRATWSQEEEITAAKEGDVNFLPAFVEWRGVLSILLIWKLENLESIIEMGPELAANRTPMKVQVWLRYASALYLDENLNLKNLLAPSETT